MKTTFEFPIYVECSKCGSKFDEDEVEITNIEENFFGQETVTFKCPRCDETVKSLRYG